MYKNFGGYLAEMYKNFVNKKNQFFYSMYLLGYLNITAPQNHPTRFKSKKKLEFICWLFRSPYLCSVLIKQLIV